MLQPPQHQAGGHCQAGPGLQCRPEPQHGPDHGQHEQHRADRHHLLLRRRHLRHPRHPDPQVPEATCRLCSVPVAAELQGSPELREGAAVLALPAGAQIRLLPGGPHSQAASRQPGPREARAVLRHAEGQGQAQLPLGAGGRILESPAAAGPDQGGGGEGGVQQETVPAGRHLPEGRHGGPSVRYLDLSKLLTSYIQI